MGREEDVGRLIWSKECGEKSVDRDFQLISSLGGFGPDLRSVSVCDSSAGCVNSCCVAPSNLGLGNPEGLFVLPMLQ